MGSWFSVNLALCVQQNSSAVFVKDFAERMFHCFKKKFKVFQQSRMIPELLVEGLGADLNVKLSYIRVFN